MERELLDADKALEQKSEIAILTKGISMRPMLREHRDVVIVERVNRPLKAGDVPLYRVAGREEFVLHRIVKCTKNGYVIRGDNLLSNEYNVKDSDIIGVLKACYRDGVYFDCATSRKYKLYSLYIRLSFPLRKLWRLKVRPILSKIKHTVFK